MGSIVLQVNGTTVGNVADGAGVQLINSVTEQDSGRLVSALGKHYASHFSEDFPPTVENIIKVWWADVIRSALRLTQKIEERELSVPPITVTEA